MFTRNRLDRYVAEGLLSRRDKDNLSLYCYTPDAQFGKRWDDVTVACRGLIMDDKDKLVALPFPKFFNLGEMPATMPQNLPKEEPQISEKLDGSLAISYWHKDELHFATKGSFDSEQAVAAKEIWRRKYSLSKTTDVLIPEQWTLMFEIIHPSSKVVVNYDFEDLVLLGVNDRYSGRCYDYRETARIAKRYGFRTPSLYAKTVDEIINEQDKAYDNTEGYVLLFGNGLRVKVKNKMYVKYHRMVSQFTDKNVWDLMRSGEFEKFLAECPEEYRDEVEALAKDIKDEHAKMTEYCTKAFTDVGLYGPLSDKEFALTVIAKYPEIQGVLFSLRKGKLEAVNKIIFNLIKEKLGI